MVVVTFLPVLGSFTEIVLTSYVLQSVFMDVTLHASAHCEWWEQRESKKLV